MDNQNLHTPGPWEASFTDSLGGPASYCRIRPVSGEMFGQFTSLEIATMHLMDEDEQQANARLIAAAPELLEALKDLLADIESLMGESYGVVGLHLNGDVAPWSDLDEGGQFERLSSLSAAHAAIAKATGASDG